MMLTLYSETAQHLYPNNAIYFVGTKPQTYFKQKMNKLQSKLATMMALNKIKGDQNVKKEQQENMQEQAILNKLQGTLTLPKITE